MGTDYVFDWYANDVIDNLIVISNDREKSVVSQQPYPVPVLRTKPTDLLNKIFPILAEFQSVGDDRNTQQSQPWARTPKTTPPGNSGTV